MENQDNKKNKPGCAITIFVLTLAVCVGLFMFGRFLKNFASELAEEEKRLQDRLDALPVLESDDEISAALNSGDPKDYLVKNYVFSNTPLIRDTVFNLLNGEYICVSVTEEWLRPKGEKHIESGEQLKDEIETERLFCQMSAPLRLHDGTVLRKGDSLVFMFSYLDKMARIWEKEVNPDKIPNFIESRYYPGHKLDLNNLDQTGPTYHSREERLSDTAKTADGDKVIPGAKYRYNFTYMSKDDKATFAVRLGNGRADLNVFPGKNVIIVGGDRIHVGGAEAMAGTVWTVMGYFFIIAAIITAITAAGRLIVNLRGGDDDEK